MWLWVLYFEGVDLDLVLLLSLLDVVAVGWLCECCSKLIFVFFPFFSFSSFLLVVLRVLNYYSYSSFDDYIYEVPRVGGGA